MNTQVAATFEDDRDYVSGRSRYTVAGIMQSLQKVATLSEALRILGAGVLLASMSVFLLQGWNDGNDINRYLLLLAQTGLLAAAGFAMSHGLKEAKGARIFFGLALVSIPANFTILGALLYSVFQWDGALTTYPEFATWQIDNIAGTGITIAGAMAVLVPATMFCYAIMARHSAKTLSIHFLLLNLLLLLPIRTSLAAGTIALLGTLYAMGIVRKAVASDRALKTGEGRFALTTLFIPMGIILFRSAYFYDVDSLMIAMLSTAVFLGLRQASLFPDRGRRVALLLDLVSLPVAIVAAVAVTGTFSADLSWAFEAPLFALVYVAFATDVLRRTESRRLARGVGVTISLIVCSCFIFGVSVETTALTAIVSLVAGILLFLAGSWLGDRTAVVTGSITMLVAACIGFDPIVDLVLASSWITLAIFGASAITLGSLLERHGVAIKLRAIKWMDEVSVSKNRDAPDG